MREMIGGVVERFGDLATTHFVSARQENLETIHQHNVVAERFGLLGELRHELATGEHARTTRRCATGSTPPGAEPVLVLGRREIEALLDLDALIDALAPAMADLSAGRASVPPRIAARVEEHDGWLAAMPGHVPSSGALVTKLVSLFPRNGARGIPTHQAVIAVFDPETGTPAALLDGTYLTAMRTGAGSALSVRLLAREDASVLAILSPAGRGVEAPPRRATRPGRRGGPRRAAPALPPQPARGAA